jgi:hypothetical protein
MRWLRNGRGWRCEAIGLTGMMVLLVSVPLSAQTTAAGHASITIGEVLRLSVHAGTGTAVMSPDGEYRELGGAVRLEVVANRPWRLGAVEHALPERQASTEAAAPEGPLWLRVARVDGAAVAGGGYVRAGSASVPLAEGPAGRVVVELDYRWLAAARAEVEPGTSLSFTLSPK